jgi:hypothetical protein
LNVNNNTALTWLSCSYNQLTAEALNALFTGLPAYSGSIKTGGNQGNSACDRSLATKKGWTFKD